VIPGATLTVKNLETGLTLITTSNDSGLYTAREVPIGSYKITVEVRGFKTVIKTDLILNAGTIQRVDFELPIGGQVETVEVVGGATPVNTESAKLSETVGATQIANLPLNGRNVYDLIQQAAGAVNATGVMYENGANTVVNGVREGELQWFSDQRGFQQRPERWVRKSTHSGYGTGISALDLEQLGRIWQQCGCDHESGY
ncbi:MAG: hypothetical protein DMG72_21365, partial [Acidobacteria bacterium]